MSKKYLGLEEAAKQLGISATELNRLREKGMIRAFADRGTWKFKEEDVENLGRSRQADSDPDVPLHVGDSGSAIDEDDSDDILGSQETIISKPLGDDSSDSDVRLIFDDAMKVEDSPKGGLLDDSDSDVKLAPAAGGAKADDSDSDVKLAGATQSPLAGGSDSDVKLVTDDIPTQDSGSDSDVRLVSSDSSGEVNLAGGSSGSVSITQPDDATIGLEPVGDSVMDEDSGISLADGGSGIALASDSGISLERPNDSGISLSEESSLVLGEDSGISLAGDLPLKTDSGISLAGNLPLKSDSGISLSKQPPSDKKKKKDVAKAAADSDDLSGTVPLMDMPASADEDLFDTQMEVPSLSDSSESNDLFSEPGSDTANVITLDDEDQGYDVTADIPVGGAALEDDDIADETDDEPVEVADDLVGEDDELSEDVFGAEDEDFADDQVESGESLSELPVSPRGFVAAAEQDWGAATHTALVLSTILTVACGTVLFDMVRNMWHTDTANHNPIASALLDMFKSI